MIFIKIIIMLSAYLVGSIPFGLLIGKLKGVDVRNVGSKNIGATNTGRALGKKYAVLVYILDMLKGALFVALFKHNIIPADFCVLNPMLYGFLACIGHTFPIFLKFKGGKSVSCGSGATAAYWPPLLLVAAIVFIVSTLCTKMVSIGSMVGAISVFLAALVLSLITKEFTLGLNGTQINGSWPYNMWFILLTFIAVTIIVIKHSTNIKRIIAGTENKIGQKK